jgi:hypothetical protein
VREALRNRLLRRVDWRFLLPESRPNETLCLSDDMAEPLRLISRVTGALPMGAPGGSFDLAVASDPSASVLETAWRALRPHGLVYTEWRQRLSGGWKEVSSRLRLAGFENVSCFWARPDPKKAPATAWIPLENPDPFEYYRTQRTPTRNPIRLAGRAARSAQWMLRPRRPVCAVARKPASSRSFAEASLGEPLLETIRGRWSEWDLGPTPRRIVPLLRAAPGRSSGKVVALLFADGDAAPRAVVKMARTPESAPGLEREAATLRLLAARPAGVAGIPRVLLTPSDGIVVETALPGLPLAASIDRASYRSLAMEAASWLASLAGPDDGARGGGARLVDQTLEEFSLRFGSVLDPGILRAVEQSLAQLPPLRTVCEQRDFSPWNVLVTSEESLSVLDWESSDPHGLPALDLIYFLTYLALYFDRAMRNGRHRDSFRRSLEPSTFTGAVAHDCLEWYSERTNLARAALGPLRLLAWMLHSRSEYRHLVEDAGAAPDPERLRRSFFLDLLMEELRCGRS